MAIDHFHRHNERYRLCYIQRWISVYQIVLPNHMSMQSKSLLFQRLCTIFQVESQRRNLHTNPIRWGRRLRTSNLFLRLLGNSRPHYHPNLVTRWTLPRTKHQNRHVHRWEFLEVRPYYPKRILFLLQVGRTRRSHHLFAMQQSTHTQRGSIPCLVESSIVPYHRFEWPHM